MHQRGVPLMVIMLVGGLAVAGPRASVAQTDNTIAAADRTGVPGADVVVPITLDLAAEVPVATLQFNLTVVPEGTAPALGTAVQFTSAVGAPALSLPEGLATVLLGWLTPFSPVLTGQVEIGTLRVRVPSSATLVTW